MGKFVSGIAVFVATYAVAVWYEYAEGDVMKYKHLAQITRWSGSLKTRMLLRCRFSKKSQCISVNIDNSDILTFKFVGNHRLSNIPAGDQFQHRPRGAATGSAAIFTE